MSTAEAGNTTDRTSGVTGGAEATQQASPDAENAAIAGARQEIRALVAEVAQLSKTDVAAEEFYEVLVGRTVSALAAVGGALWTLRDDGVLSLEFQVNYRQTGLVEEPGVSDAQLVSQNQARHGRLLRRSLDQPHGTLVAPHSGSTGDAEAANPTDYLLILAPLGGDQPTAVLEIFQRPGAGPVTQRGYLRFLLQMSEIATDFLKSRRLRQFEDRQILWGQLNQFTQTVHRSLDPRRAAFTIANEGRRLIECDRLSLATCQGRRCRITAVSNQDTPDKRSNVITSLTKLAQRVVATGEPVWFTGDSRRLSPQVEEAIDSHVDISHAKAIGILPLVRPLDADGDEGKDAAKAKPKDVLGALVIERFDEARFHEGLLHRAELVRQHSATALGNALDHHGPLMPLLRKMGRSRAVTSARSVPKTLSVLVAVVLAVASLFVIPADFQLEARGTLEPSIRRDLFVQEPGLVTDVFAKHGELVAEGMPLVQLRSRDLEVQITDLTGRRLATEEQIAAMRRARNDPRLPADERDRLASQLKELQGTFDSLSGQIELLETKRDQLTLKSPIAGQVITWDVSNRLMRRPVDKGQLLMTVADPAGPWELELQMREDRMGHIARAAAQARKEGEPLAVEYIMATDPGESREGKVVRIQSAAEVRGQEGNTVLIRVSPDRSQLENVELRPGATVTAKIHCGRRSLGYVWFHDVIAFVNSKILFRL